MTRKNSVFGWIILALALVISLGSFTFLSPCVHADGAVGPCHWAGKAVLGAGCALALQALLAAFSKGSREKALLYLALVPTAVLGILLPGGLISLCKMSSMRCRAIMQPAVILLFSLALLLALIGFWAESRKK